MGFTVNTNIDALNTYRNLQTTQSSLSNSLAKLSSGLRINTAGDDAAGLTIATALGAQVSGLAQASRNAQDGQSVVQTADGALTQVQSLLGRLRDLAVQAANDSNSGSARTAIGNEATQITAEVTRLGQAVNFNGTNLLDGTANLTFQVGADGNSQSQIGVNLTTVNLGTIATALTNTSTATFTVGTTTASSYSFTGGGTTVSVAVATAGLTGTQFAAALNANADFAKNFNAVATGASLAVSSKTGATMAATAPGAGIAAGAVTNPAVQYNNAANSQAAIGVIDTQLSTISTARAQIGALQNRFTSATTTIATSITNLTAAKSRITDVDMAAEMVNYSRANILSQSGTAMLAQANSASQLVLKLLQ